MVELVGDPCMPNTLIVPVNEDDTRTTDMSGALLISGGSLYFMGNDRLYLVTAT